MTFTLKTDNFEYEPAAVGSGPTYLSTGDNPEGMCVELHYTRAYRKKDDNGRTIIGDYAWHVSEFDRDGDRMDEYWFVDFSAADAKAKELWDASYDHEAVTYGSKHPEPENYDFSRDRTHHEQAPQGAPDFEGDK